MGRWDLDMGGTYTQGKVNLLGMVVVKELHDIQQEEEGVAEMASC